MAITTDNGLGRSLPAIATGVGTIVCMFMPWASIPLAGMAGMLTGIGNIPTEFSVLDAFDFMRLALSESQTDFAAPAMVYGFMALWVAGIGFTAWGALLSLQGNVHKNLSVGGIFALITAVAWYAGVSYINAQISGEVAVKAVNVTMWPIGTAFLGIATAVLAAGAEGSSPSVSRPPVAQPATPSVAPRVETRTTQPVETRAAQPVETRVPQTTVPQTTPEPEISFAQTSCVCPSCGYTVEVEVPVVECTVNITCGHCGTQFPMEVRPRR